MMFKKEKTKIHYYSMNDIIKSIKNSQECHIMERAFDWKEISIKGFFNKHRIMKICKPYGKVVPLRRGFVIKFNY